MKRIKPFLYLCKKEIQGFYFSPIMYIFTMTLLVILGYYFWKAIAFSHVATMRDFFEIISWLFIIFIPALGMRLWSDEKKTGTDEILLTIAPSFISVILAKWVGLMSYVMFIFIASLPYVFFLRSASNFDFGPVLGSYLGAFFLAGMYGAISIWVSSLTKNQLVAFVGSVLIVGAMYVVGFIPRGNIFSVLSEYSTRVQFELFSKGLVDVADTLFFISITVLFVFFSYLSLVKKRYAKK